MKKKSLFWITVSIIAVITAMILCFVGAGKGILIAKPLGDPQKTVTEFLDAIIAGDYQKAYGYLDGYSTLGLEQEPESPEGKLVMEALKQSYSYSLSGTCAKKGINASQIILLSRLDVKAVNNYAAARSDLDYLSALQTVLADVRQYYTSDIIDISLKYINGQWKIIPDSTLISALQGGLS